MQENEIRPTAWDIFKIVLVIVGFIIMLFTAGLMFIALVIFMAVVGIGGWITSKLWERDYEK